MITSTEKQLEALRVARARYLEQQCLLQEVEGLVLDAGHLLQQQDSSDVVASAEHVSMQVPLRSLGIYCPASTVTSLGQHLQAAYVVQRLQLPAAVLSQQPHGNRIPSAQDKDAKAGLDQQYGSIEHVYGVTPQQLQLQFGLSKKAAQKLHAPLIPTLEQRLDRTAEAAVAAIAGPAAGTDSAARVIDTVQAKQSELRSLQQDNQQLLARYTAEAEGYLADLTSVQQVLQQLLEEVIMQQVPEYDRHRLEHKKVFIQMLINKLQNMQLVIRKTTYTQSTIPALSVIKEQLDEEEQQLEQAVEEVSMQLLAYSQLGEDFEQIAKDYTAVKAQEGELDNVIDNLQRVEDEASQIY